MFRTLLLASAAISFAAMPVAAAPVMHRAAAASATLPASNPFAKPSTLPFHLTVPGTGKILWRRLSE